jgi:hypothetical protein
VSTEFYWLAVVATTIVSAARLTRLAVVDKFPPVKWLRNKYSDATDSNDWWWLMNCGYCFSFWATVFVVGWGWFSGVYETGADGVSGNVWWLANGVLAASYLAAVFMARDADDEDD